MSPLPKGSWSDPVRDGLKDAFIHVAMVRA